jgi:5-methylcytosine-specific restriction endonuclease McrA
MDYQKYLKSDHWQSVRTRQLRKPDKQFCYLCGSADSLNIHHLIYRDKNGKSFLGRENGSILRTFCSECHSLYHKHFELSGSTRYMYRLKNLLKTGTSKVDAFSAVSMGKHIYRQLLKSNAKGNLNSV